MERVWPLPRWFIITRHLHIPSNFPIPFPDNDRQTQAKHVGLATIFLLFSGSGRSQEDYSQASPGFFLHTSWFLGRYF